MKGFERILIKVVVIQFTFLVLSQLIFHQLEIFPEVRQLTKYEGVNENALVEFLETFNGK